MTSELVEHATNRGLTVVQPGTGGVADPSDYAIPYIKLVQASSEEVKDGVAKPGVFLSSEGGTVEYINFVPMHIQFTRDFYDADKGKNVCSSQDRVTGYPRDARTFAEMDFEVQEGEPLTCVECPFNNMPPREKRACKKGYTVTGYDVDTETPFMFRVKGVAMGVFKNRLVGAVAMGRSVPWARQFEMSSAKKSTNGNSYFVPVLEPTKSNDESERQFYAAMAEGYGETVHPDRVADAPDADDTPFE